MNIEAHKVRKKGIDYPKWGGRLFAGVVLFALCGVAMAAGAEGEAIGLEEVEGIYEWLRNLIKGVGGRIISLLFIFIGVIMGLRQGSIFAFVTGFAVAILFYFTPDILEAVTGATIVLN